LARISFSPIAQHYLTTFGLDDENAIVLDMRSPGAPVAELRGHGGALGAVGWGLGSRAGTGGGGWIATCGKFAVLSFFSNLRDPNTYSGLLILSGDDAQLLLYDLTSPLPFPASTSTPSLKPASNQPSRSPTPAPTRTPSIQPSMAWNASAEINNLAWGSEGSGLIGSVSGRRVTCLRV
jgi:DDB1- and CUL4-associated factor 7